MKRIPLVGLLALTLCVPFVLHAGENPDWQISYLWDGVPVLEGLAYEFPLGNPHLHYAEYRWPGGYATGNFYQGRFQEGATRFYRHGFGQGGIQTEFGTDHFPTNGDYFVVIYSTPPFLPFEHLEKMDEWFKNGTTNDPTAFPPTSWGIIRFHVGPANSAPTIQNLAQYRQFGVDTVAEGATFVGNSAVFKADVADAGSQVKLEVEVKPIGIAFDEANTITSMLSSSGTHEIAHDELIPITEHYQSGGNVKSFHWRARAVNEQGLASSWQEFGTTGNTDFTAKVVPLWTQVRSGFPGDEETLNWSTASFASGFDEDCAPNAPNFAATIADCGCAITSAVMLARYHGLTEGIDASPLTPASLNTYLKEHGGYTSTNHMNWSVVQKYLGTMVDNKPRSWFALETVHDGSSRTHQIRDRSVLDNFLESAPFFAFDERVGHFFLVDDKVNRPANIPTYTLRDPFWYETKTLDETTAVPKRVRRYGNTFSYGTVLTKLAEPRIVSAHTELFLASPAEILVTDPQGRKVGKDPRTGQYFSDIPGATYQEEDPIGTSEVDLDQNTIHRIKSLYLPELLDGSYSTEVIGTGSGSFTLTSVMTGSSGTATTKTFVASTTSNQVTSYQLTVQNGEPTDTKLSVTVPDLLTQLKSAIQVSNAKPLVKAALYAQVVLIEKAYTTGKLAEARKLLALLEKEVLFLKQKKQLLVLYADKMLAIITELKKVL